MILVYDMSGGERLDAVPGGAEIGSCLPEVERPMMREPEVAPALQEVRFEVPASRPHPLAAVDVEGLLRRMS